MLVQSSLIEWLKRSVKKRSLPLSFGKDFGHMVSLVSVGSGGYFISKAS
jgi:hypothetical protein